MEAVCYVFALVLLVLAAVLWSTVPYRDRMAYAGLALWLLPTAVHALQVH